MKAMNKVIRGICGFLTAILLIGGYAFSVVPRTSAASVEETGSVKLDFKEAVIAMSEQSWWQELQAAGNSDTKYIGSKTGSAFMSAEAKEAYTQMQSWLSENYGWEIDETISCFTNSYYLKQLYFNCAENIPWGISYNAWYLNMDARNDLSFTFRVPQAGWYRLDIEAFHEATTGKNYTQETTGYYPGGGYGDVYVNDKLIYKEYSFGGNNTTLKQGMGAVYLNEGENTVMISAVLDYNGETVSSRRLIGLRSLEFVGLGDLYVETASDTEIDLSLSYLPFDKMLTSAHTVSSANTAVAKVDITDDGKLLVSGMAKGSTTVTLKENGVKLFDIPVTIVDSVSDIEEITRVSYTLNGFEAATLKYGTVAAGEVVALSNFQDEYDIDTIRAKGDIYFVSDNTAVARVDQQGDVICVGEGSAVIKVYAQIDGVLFKDKVYLVVSDDTDLASINLEANVDYVGIGNKLHLQAAGKKESGGCANMENFPVAYSVDDESVATIDDNGYLTGHSAGTVIVTGACGVDQTEVKDTITVEVVENSDLAGNDVILDFTDGRAQAIENAVLEKDGMELNRTLTVSTGSTLGYSTKHGIELTSARIGEKIAIDFVVDKDNWYVIETWGSLFSYGGVADVFIDDSFAGIMDFDQDKNSTYSGNSIMNTLYLEAGKHTCVLECVERGSFFLGKIICRATTDPNQMEILPGSKTELLVGESSEVAPVITKQNDRGVFTLKNVDASVTPDYTNYYKLTSSRTSVLSVSGKTVKAVAAGTATLTMTGEINGQAFTKKTNVTVKAGNVYSAELTAGETTMKPTDSGTDLTLTVYSVGGTEIDIPSGTSVSYTSADTSIASVSSAGRVTITGKEGTAKITVTILENGRAVTADLWITVTKGKTEPTIFTYEERATALENVSKYSWAASMKRTAVKNADAVITNLDAYYDSFIHQTFPRRTRVGTKNDPEAYFCRYCKVDLADQYTVYPWIVDPINNPWKITCPACKRDFPSNDFESYYESGLGTDGKFYPEKANSKYLVNELYPEMGAGWGVDDGFGYDTGRTYSNGAEEIHTYIGYYMHCVFDSLSKYAVNDMVTALTALQDAYLYTGDEKYGSAGAILLDRIADIYPSYNYYIHDSMYGGFDKGKIVNAIWEAVTIGQCLAQAADAFWPAMDNTDVIEYLQEHAAWKGVSANEITPEYVRNNVDNGILLQIKEACETGNNLGNFGMQQASMAYAAVALDRLPETQEMIDWIFRYGENKALNTKDMVVTGGNVLYRLVNDVDRDGIGNEGSNMYNPMWFQNLMEVAEALNGYDRVSGVDLWKNPKFVTMFNALNRLVVCGTGMMTTGEAGYVQSNGSYADTACMLEAFIQTGNREIARGLYYSKGNSVSGIHGSIFTKDPEAGIQSAILKIVEEDGEWNWNRSEMLCGEGIAILRNGPEKLKKGVNDDLFSDYWMFFGICGGSHGALEALNIGVEAFGVIASPTLGYPKVVNTSDPERMQWMLNTVSHNTVVVNDKSQSRISVNSFPLHFDDAGEVKLMDAEAPNAYGETDIYRRTLISVQAQDNVYYAVDFFRVLGGREHVYSFHAASTIDPQTEGLDFVHQAMGTYAGPEIPFGFYQSNPNSTDAGVNMGSGYSWLDNVYRDDTPETTFSVDFEIEDFNNKVINSEGVRMKLTMLSEEPLTEVAIADGHPTQNGRNPEILKYLLVRRSGRPGMDTLFTSVIEPYRNETYISDAKLLEVRAVSGDEKAIDKAAAIKVTLTSGRNDYIIYATNPDVVYCVLEDGVEVLQFRGFAGVCSYLNGSITYAYGHEASIMATATGVNMLSEKQASVTGKVLDFTKGLEDQYTLTISMDVPVEPDALEGRYIYVENDGMENGAYQIYGAEVSGNTAVLNLHTQTLVRSYVDGNDLTKGYAYNIAVDQAYNIPLSTEVDCFHSRNSVKYVRNGDGTHTVIRSCTACGIVTSTSSAACKDGSDTDTKCDRCGAEMPAEIEKFNVTGVNMTLGNELELNIMLPKATIDAYGKDLTVTVIHHEYVDGDTEYTFNMADLPLYGGDRYYKASIRVAAAQMTDLVDVVVTDAEGNVYSNEFTTSVLTYVTNNLDKQTAKVKTLLVDMVNYGAAAQDNFSYRQDLYANSNLTEAQKLLATGDVTCTDIRVKGDNYVGSNLSLQDCILLNFMFTGVADDVRETMYATVSFTGVLGNEVNVRVPVEKLMTRYAGVAVNQIVLADAVTPVTVTIYNADGSVYGYATDSVESYNARQNPNGTNALYTNIMKFAASAYAYKQ